MDYRKLIKEEIEKLHTAKGVTVNPKIDSDLGEQIVSDICSRLVKNCLIADVVKPKGTLPVSPLDITQEEWIENCERLFGGNPNKG